MTHKLVSLIQSGALTGVDITRTHDRGRRMGTRRFHDVRANGPNQADVVVFPQDDWTLNQVDATNTDAWPVPGAHRRRTRATAASPPTSSTCR